MDDSGRSDLIFRAIAEAADNARLGVTVTESRGDEVHFLFANSALLALLGTDRATLQERGVWGFIAPDEVERLKHMMRDRALGGAPPKVFETVLLRAGTERVPVEISTTYVKLDGRLANVTFVSDISALSRSEARFARLITGAPDGVVILRWPTILFVNQRAAEMLGVADQAEAIGRPLTDFMEPSEVQEADARAVVAQRDRAPLGPREYTGRDSDGQRLTVEVSSIPIEYEGRPALLAFARDVTERKAMLNKLARADKLAAVGTLAAGVAHEINNPLAYLLLNIDLLRRELPRSGGDPERIEALMTRLDECKQGAERVKTIVRDLQAFTRKDEDIRGPVDLEAVVLAASQLARHQLDSRTTLTHDFAELPPAHGNATRLEQLFLNLLLNAAHAVTEAARKEGHVHVRTLRGTGDTLLVQVQDNGVGISADLQAHVFDPFFTTKPQGVGTGLGLAMCHAIARAVGGDVQLESTPDVGTTVTVELPIHHDAAEPQPAAPAVPEAPSAISGGGPRLRILIVDDEHSVVSSLSAALDDHDVVSCLNASEAREALAGPGRFDVVLCDLMLRGETGMELYRDVIERHPELRDRFVFMTGGAYLRDAQEFLEHVGSPYLEKPFELSALRQLFESMRD